MHSLNGICGVTVGKNSADFDVSEISRYQEVDLQLLARPVLPTGCCFQENLAIILAFFFFLLQRITKKVKYTKRLLWRLGSGCYSNNSQLSKCKQRRRRLEGGPQTTVTVFEE